MRAFFSPSPLGAASDRELIEPSAIIVVTVVSVCFMGLFLVRQMKRECCKRVANFLTVKDAKGANDVKSLGLCSHFEPRKKRKTRKF